MTLRKSWTVAGSTPADGATALDGRLAQAGLYAQNANGSIRAGILGARTGIVSSRSDMALDIDWFEAVLTRSAAYGVTPVANDGVVGVVLPAAPSSNSRWVRVYVIQRDNVDGADADNEPIFGVVSGAAAASPTLPAVPSGALPIARVLQPANVLGTADCTVTEDYPMTNTRGSEVPLRNTTELTGFAAANDTLAHQLDSGAHWQRVGSGWAELDSDQWHDYTPEWNAPTPPSIGNGALIGRWKKSGQRAIVVRIDIQFGSTTAGGAGDWTLGLPTGFATPANKGRQAIPGKVFSATRPAHFAAVAEISPGSSVMALYAPAGDSVTYLERVRNSGTSPSTPGNGVPLVPTKYTYTEGATVTFEGIVEVA